MQVSRTLAERISKYAGVVLETVAYAGTGDVLKVQRLLALCGEHTEVDDASAWKVGLPFNGTDSLCSLGMKCACQHVMDLALS